MSGQLEISWPDPDRHPAVRVSDPDTCVEPSQPRMSAGRWLALEQHAQHQAGLTDFELAELTGRAQTSVGKRRGELVAAGLVVGTTERRPAPSGAPAIVWRITPLGVETWRAR